MGRFISSVDTSQTGQIIGPYGRSVAIATCPAIEEYFYPKETDKRLGLSQRDVGLHCDVTPRSYALPQRSYVAYDFKGDPYEIGASLPKEELMSLFEVSVLLRAHPHLAGDPSFLATKDSIAEYILFNYFFVAGINGPVFIDAAWDDFSDARWDWPLEIWNLDAKQITNAVRSREKYPPPWSGRYIFRNRHATP